MIEDVLSISISLDSPPIGVSTFEQIVVGTTVGFSERLRWYTSAAALLADTEAGVSSSDYEYLALSAIFSQPNHPDRVAVGRGDDTFVAQVDEYEITTAAAGDWILTINGTAYTFTADGADAVADIAAGLIAASGADPLVTVAAGAGAVFTCTADNAGVSFTSSVTAPSGGAYTKSDVGSGSTANVGWGDVFDAIFAEDDSAYFVNVETRDEYQLEEVALRIESLYKFAIVQCNQADIISATATDDLASKLQDELYYRTMVLYHSDDSEMAAEAWTARRGSADLDTESNAWAFATLTGVTADSLTSTVQTTITGKSANFYETLAGVGATWKGLVPAGKYADEVIIRDWLHFRLEEDIYRWYLETYNRNEKIPYTDDGIKAHGAMTRNRLQKGVKAGHFTDYTVTMPLRADVDDTDVDNRELSWEFTAYLSGAIHGSVITGYVTTDIP
jgi:hypothetical protein